MEGVFVWIMKSDECVSLQSSDEEKRGADRENWSRATEGTLCLKHLTGNERFWR